MVEGVACCAAGSSLSGLSPGGSLELPDSAMGATSARQGGPAAPAPQGGDPSLMGSHTGPTQESADFAQKAQDRAKTAREAQQRQLADKTGDTLYPASGLSQLWSSLAMFMSRECTCVALWRLGIQQEHGLLPVS